MITSPWQGHQLSRMMLGTVQFGMPYGVSNRTGQPKYRDVLAMLAAAIEGGVNCFDTAAAYGTSEEVLGRALRELGFADRAVVVTKVRPLTPAGAADPTLTSRAIEQSVAESRQRLQRDCLPVVLFHRESDAVHLHVLEELRQRGWLRQAGVSCDNCPGPAAGFVSGGRVTALQLPGNVVDPRHQQSGVFSQAADCGVAVFIRSVYLQGLLVMPEADIPPPLQAIIPVRHRLSRIAQEGGLTLGELALRYMLGQAGVTCVITGVETIAQVQDNIAMFNRGPLPGDVVEAVSALATDLPEAVLTPGMWPALKNL